MYAVSGSFSSMILSTASYHSQTLSTPSSFDSAMMVSLPTVISTKSSLVICRGACTTGAAGAAAPLALVVRGQAGAEKCPFTILGRLAKSVCYIKRARLDENVSETLHDWKRQHTHCSMLGCTVHAKC